MRKRNAVLLVAVSTGVLLLLYSLNVGVTIGSVWFGEKATEPWRMNNYYIIDGQHAYIFYGLGSLALGGLTTGLSLPVFSVRTKSKKCLLALAGFFFAAIVLTGLGFNTLDFMLGIFYWTNMKEPPPVQVPIIGQLGAWYFYFFLFVIPLWFSGFLIGTAASIHTFFSATHHKENASQKTVHLDKPLRDTIIK